MLAIYEEKVDVLSRLFSSCLISGYTFLVRFWLHSFSRAVSRVTQHLTVPFYADQEHFESIFRHDIAWRGSSRHCPLCRFFEFCWTPEGWGQRETNLPHHGRDPRGGFATHTEDHPASSQLHVVVCRGVGDDLPVIVCPETASHVRQMSPGCTEPAADDWTVQELARGIIDVIDRIQLRHPQHDDRREASANHGRPREADVTWWPRLSSDPGLRNVCRQTCNLPQGRTQSWWVTNLYNSSLRPTRTFCRKNGRLHKDDNRLFCNRLSNFSYEFASFFSSFFYSFQGSPRYSTVFWFFRATDVFWPVCPIERKKKESGYSERQTYALKYNTS